MTGVRNGVSPPPAVCDEDEEVMNLEQTEELLRCSYFFVLRDFPEFHICA